jgi:cobalt-zinc-cadmium efflux system outer membrane protein
LNYLRNYAITGAGEILGTEQAALNSIAHAREAGLFPNPVFSYQMQNVPIGSGGGGAAAVAQSRQLAGLTVAIPTGNRISASRAEARAVAETTSSSLTLARIDFIRRIDEAYAHYLGARERARLAKGEEATVAAFFDDLEKRVAAGKAPKFELLATRAILNQRTLAAEAAQEDASAAESELRALVRADITAILARGELPKSAPPLDVEALRAKAAKTSPSIVRYELELARANATLERCRAERFPDLTATLLGGYEGDRNSPIITFGVAVPLPIFNRNQYAVDLAMEDRERVERELAGERLLSQTTAESLARDYERARTHLVRYRDRLIPDANAALDEVEKELRAGRATGRDLLLAKGALEILRRLELEEREKLARAIAEIERLIGEPVPTKAP